MLKKYMKHCVLV